jgi:hypothetical protein
MTLNLTNEESELLGGVLRKALGELREEVYHADTPTFKDELKHDEGVLRSLIDKLGPEAEAELPPTSPLRY